MYHRLGGRQAVAQFRTAMVHDSISRPSIPFSLFIISSLDITAGYPVVVLLTSAFRQAGPILSEIPLLSIYPAVVNELYSRISMCSHISNVHISHHQQVQVNIFHRHLY